MCFGATNGSGPTYLSELLHVYTPSRERRSSSAPTPEIQTQDSGLLHFVLLWTLQIAFHLHETLYAPLDSCIF